MNYGHVRNAMNGAPVPNWVKLGAFWLALGWIAANQWASVKATKNEVVNEVGGKVDSLRTDIVTRAVINDARAQVTDARFNNVEARLDRIELRIDYRIQQARNDVAEVKEKIDRHK